MIASVVVADADTLFPAATRGLLIYLDYAGLIRLHWSFMILDELSRALVSTGRKKTLADAKTNEERMHDALPHALISTQEVHSSMRVVEPAVNSAKDMHVAACAYATIASRAYPHAVGRVLITRNIKDFKKKPLAALGISLLNPDAYLNSLFHAHGKTFASAFRMFRMDLQSRPEREFLIDRLQKEGQVKTALALLAAHRTGHASL